MKRTVRMKAAGIALVAALAVAGCGGGDDGGDAGSAAGTGGDLVMVRAEDSTSLLPPETSANVDIWTLQQVYETLTVNRADGSGVDPLLATGWTTSDDGLTWTFDIRQGVTFHDGSPLTAADVAWSLDFDRTESDTNQWWSIFSPIDSVTAPDDTTVEVVLSQPFPQLPAYLALFAAAVYPEDFADHDEAYMREHPIGTGPFMFREWVKGSSLSIAKYPGYWDPQFPYLDSVTFNVVPDDNTRMLQLQGGQAQIDEFPSPASMATLQQTSGVVAEDVESTQVLFVNLNNRSEGLDDPVARRALSYAVDRQSILDTVLSGFGTVANSFLSPGLAGHDDQVDGGVFDMDLAKETLAASEHPDGFPLTIEVSAGNSDYEQIAQVLQQSWGELGIDVTIKPVDGTVASSDRRAGTFDVQVGYATSDVVDPYQMVDFLVLTDGRGINSGYTGEQVYGLADQLAATGDPAEQAELLSQIQQIVADEAPLIPIAFQPLLYAYSDQVQGFHSGVLGTYSLKTTSLED